MPFIRRHLLAAAALAGLALPASASASIIFDTALNLTGQGFGNEPRLLTLQETGNGDDVESACVAAGSGGSISFGAGACIADSQVFQGNGKTNTGGDEVNPMADNQKYGVPTLGELGFADASDIGLLFNAVEPAGNGVTIDDVTLKFYDDGILLAAIDGSHRLGSTRPGNGNAGFFFTVDASQQAFLDATIFSLDDFSTIRIALESTISGAQAGPESWLAFNTGRSVPVPAPAGLALFGIGLIVPALARRARKRA